MKKTPAFKDETSQGEQWNVERIKTYEKNAKIHNDKQVQELAASITSFGWRSRILVDTDGIIIAGHGRFAAAKSLGLETVPVTVARDLTDAQIKALRLADNKVTSTKYDTDALLTELEAIHVGMEFDMSDFFDDKELDFASFDLGDIDLDALTSDISIDVSDQSETTQALLKDEGDQEVSVTKALGFSRVNPDQRRLLTHFMAHISAMYGVEPLEALLAHARLALDAEQTPAR